MPFGIDSATGKFQIVMDDMLRDLPWVKCYLDDILISARSPKEHKERVVEVFKRLQRAGVRLSRKKCLSGVTELTYLGFVISKHGLKTSPDKVKAVQEAQRPQDLPAFCSYLGLVNYYWKFVPKLAQGHPYTNCWKRGPHGGGRTNKGKPGSNLKSYWAVRKCYAPTTPT